MRRLFVSDALLFGMSDSLLRKLASLFSYHHIAPETRSQRQPSHHRRSLALREAGPIFASRETFGDASDSPPVMLVSLASRNLRSRKRDRRWATSGRKSRITKGWSTRCGRRRCIPRFTRSDWVKSLFYSSRWLNEQLPVQENLIPSLAREEKVSSSPLPF